VGSVVGGQLFYHPHAFVFLLEFFICITNGPQVFLPEGIDGLSFAVDSFLVQWVGDSTFLEVSENVDRRILNILLLALTLEQQVNYFGLSLPNQGIAVA